MMEKISILVLPDVQIVAVDREIGLTLVMRPNLLHKTRCYFLLASLQTY